MILVEDNMTISSETPEEEALRNSIILHQIMQYSSPDYLKRNRLVNKDWWSAATSTALQRDCFQVRLKCVNNFDSFTHTVRGSRLIPGNSSRAVKNKCLEELNKILENSLQFPSTDFHFDQGNLASIDVQEFFEIYGANIKTLSLRSTPGLRACVTSRETFQKILKDQAPNVETLTVDGFDFRWEESDQIFLPNLKKIVLPAQSDDSAAVETDGVIITKSTLEWLLCAAEGGQLKSVLSFLPPLHTKLVEKTGKLHLVKSLAQFNVNWPSQWTIEELTKFTTARPSLVEFHMAMPERGFSGGTEELVELFLKILTSSKKSLQKLQLGELHYNNHGMKGQSIFPRLENLKILILNEPAGSGGHYFPKGTPIVTTFPNLKTLTFGPSYSWDKHSLFSDDTLKDGGSEDPGFVSVQNLEIHDNFSEDCMEKVKTNLCPNFKNLKLHGFCRLDQFLPTIFRVWSHIQRLTVMVDSLQNFDEAFTGFNKEQRSLLAAVNETGAAVEMAEFSRSSPWIGDCEDLKKLEINLCSPSSYFTAGNGRPFTRLCGLHGFQHLLTKNVDVTIGYDKFARWSYRLERTLVSVAPFTTIVQYPVDR